MRDTLRATDKRVSELKSEAAEPFETTIVENRVFEALGASDRLRQLVDVAERAYRLEEDDGYIDDVQRTAFGAAEDLNGHVDDIIDREVARECATVLKDARTGWFDHEDESTIEAAVDEARTWLADHPEVARHAGIDVDALDVDTDDDVQEVSA